MTENLDSVRGQDLAAAARRAGAALPRRTALLLLLLLGGCASMVQDRGFEQVKAMTAEQLGKEIKWVRSEEDARAVEQVIDELLKAPLTVDGAVQIALLNNRGLQAAYNELGLSAAAMVRSITPPNPGFSYARLKQGHEIEFERRFTLDALTLLAMPFGAAVEDRRWEHAKLRTADQVLQIALETRRAWYSAVAAQQLVSYFDQVKQSALATAEMSRRLGQTGAFSKLNQAREYVFYADVATQSARGRQASRSDRERLTRLMGLWGRHASYRLPDRLPELPKEIAEQRDIEARAIAERLDIRMGRLEVEGLARSYGLTQATRFVNVLEVSYLSNSFKGEPGQTGYEIELSIPIFDFGTTRAVEAENAYLQAANKLAELAVNARSEVREAYEAYRVNHELATQYLRDIIPARQLISEESLLRYNGMLASIFELLADSREQISSVMTAIETQRDYWIADADLQSALISGGARGLQAAGAPRAPARAAGGGH